MPVACEFFPTAKDVLELGKRGWKVHAFVNSRACFDKISGEATQDIEAIAIAGKISTPEDFRRLVSLVGNDTGIPAFARAKSLKFTRMLHGAGISPAYLAVRRPWGTNSVKLLRKWGYKGFAIVSRAGHSRGGPVAQGLDYEPLEEFAGIGRGEELHAYLDSGTRA